MQRQLLASLILLFSISGCNDRQLTNAVSDAEPEPLKTSDPEAIDPETVLVGSEPSWVSAPDLAAVPEDAEGLIFLRRNHLGVHLNEDGQSTYQNQRIRILDSRALDIGNLSLIWNPASGQPIVHKLLIHRNNETINVLDKDQFEVFRREDLLEQAILTGYLTAVLRISDLRVGDELEWSFTTPSHDPTLKSQSYGLLTLGAAPVPGRHTIRLSWEKTQEPSIQLSDDLSSLANRTQQAVSVALDDPQPINVPQDAPLRYRWQRIIEFSDFATWSAISEYFSHLYDQASRISTESALAVEVRQIADQHEEPLERASAALELVQRQIRYIFVGLNGGNFTPATADETWNRRYGDCKGKVALLLALLRELDIEAEAVLVNNSGLDDGINYHLANPLMFDHVIVRARIGGTSYWLDPTLPDIIGPGKQPFAPYRWVLPLSANGEPLERLEEKVLELPQEMGVMEYDARAGFAEPARKVTTNVKRGVAGLTEYMQFSAVPPEQLETSLRNAYTNGNEWDVVDNVSYRYDRSTQASILTITGTGPVDWDSKDDGRYYLSLPGGGFNPPAKRQRSQEQDGTLPFYTDPTFSCYVTTVRLPDETNLENWGFNSTFETEIFGRSYYRMMERNDDHTIRMVRGSRVENAEITPEKARRDNYRIDDFDNSMARIKYTPEKAIASKRSGNVPATYEFDWTSANAPCLPGSLQMSGQ